MGAVCSRLWQLPNRVWQLPKSGLAAAKPGFLYNFIACLRIFVLIFAWGGDLLYSNPINSNPITPFHNKEKMFLDRDLQFWSQYKHIFHENRKIIGKSLKILEKSYKKQANK